MPDLRLRRIQLVCLVALLPFLLTALFLVEERVRGGIMLRKARRELSKTLGEAPPPQPKAERSPDENGAPEFQRLANILANRLLTVSPPAMVLTRSGNGIVCFREAAWLGAGTDDPWKKLEASLRENRATLSEIQTTLEKPFFEHRMNRAEGFLMRMPHLPPVKTVAQWLCAENQSALHHGEHSRAVKALLAQLRLPKVLADDHLTISELMRCALVSITRSFAWETLHSEDWTEAELAELQQACAELQFLFPVVRAMKEELAVTDGAFQRVGRSHDETVQTLYGLAKAFPVPDADRPAWERGLRNLFGSDDAARFLKEQVYARIWRFAWLDQAACRHLERQQALTAIADRALEVRSAQQINKEDLARFEDEQRPRGFYDRLRYPAPLFRVAIADHALTRAMRAETERSLMLSAIAVKRRALQRGFPPGSLSSIVPELLPEVPLDYLDGKPIRYRRTAGTVFQPDGPEGSQPQFRKHAFLLYSVGDNGTDDGGNSMLLPQRWNVRNLWERTDVVWPAEATPEELATYRREVGHVHE